MEEADVFIRDYFNGKLNVEEAQAFHDRYAEDPEFKKLSDQIEVEVLGIRSASREQLRFKFQSWENEASENKVRQGFPLFKMGVAASLLIVIAIFGKSFLTLVDEDLFLAYYEPYENFEYTTARNEPGEASSFEYWAYSSYDAEDYVLAEKYFDQIILNSPENVAAVFFRGICRMERSSYGQALNDLASVADSGHAYYSDAALWYMSLVEIKLGHKEKARQHLKRLNSSKDYQAKAQELLEELN